MLANHVRIVEIMNGMLERQNKTAVTVSIGSQNTAHLISFYHADCIGWFLSLFLHL
jgi:hypothetical protein